MQQYKDSEHNELQNIFNKLRNSVKGTEGLVRIKYGEYSIAVSDEQNILKVTTLYILFNTYSVITNCYKYVFHLFIYLCRDY